MDTKNFGEPEYLVSQSTHTCLTVVGGTGVHDAVITMRKCNGGVKQQWYHKNGKLHWGGNQSLCLFKNKSGDLCLVPCDTVTESWVHDQEGRLTLGSLALDIPWASPRTRVLLYPKHSGGNQKWWTFSQLKEYLDDKEWAGEHCLPPTVSEICKKEIRRCAFGKEECTCQGTHTSNMPVKEKSIAQFGEPEYLISQSTHTCLTVLNFKHPGDAKIGLSPYTGDINQQWLTNNGVWLWAGDPTYCLVPNVEKSCLQLLPRNNEKASWVMDKSGVFMHGSKALDVPWDGDRTRVILYPRHGGINQKWWLLSNIKPCIGKKIYPLPVNDEKAYKQEIARGIVNHLYPLSDPLPHPRDITYYPGTVSPTTPRVNMLCNLKVATVKQAKNLRMTVPLDWQATNMYVANGDVFTVILPETLSDKQADQITIRVGAQCDCLDPSSPNLKNGSFQRMPVISEEFDLNPGTNQLRSQYGGNLIFTYEGDESFDVAVEVKNVVETPHYIRGKSSRDDWNRVKHLDAPFSVLETNKVVLIVPTSKARKILDVESLLQQYDDVMTLLEDLSGFTEKDPPPQGKQWLVDDVQITAGSAHAGFPAMFNNKYYDLTSPETPHNWVVWHELGHNYQQSKYWSYAYGSETTVNLFSLYIQEILKKDDRLKKENKYVPTVKAVDKGLTFKTADCWQKLVFLMEIKHAFPRYGWEMYKHLNRSVRALSNEEAKVVESSSQNQYDYVYCTLSKYIGVNLFPHYKRWGLSISKEAQNEIKSLGLPKSSDNLLANCHPQIYTS